MTPWKPPTTKTGQPCKRCRKGAVCPSHRLRKPEKTEGKRGRYKLRRPLLDTLPAIVAKARNYTEIYNALGIGHEAFYQWLRQGQSDAGEGQASLEREFWEIVTYHRILLAQRMMGCAVEAAEGVRIQEETKDGPAVYQRAPDGRLAASIARSLDPSALPPERQEIKHDATFTVADDARDKLKRLFNED